MQKSVSSRSYSLSRPSYIVLCLLLCFVIVFALGLTFLAFERSFRYKKEYNIDQSQFSKLVNIAVTNYLQQVLQVPDTNSPSFNPSVSTNNAVSITFRHGCTWMSPSGRMGCVVDGVEYYEGDFLEEGLLLKISDLRLYIRGWDGLPRIVRLTDKVQDSRRQAPADLPRRSAEGFGGFDGTI